MTETIGKRRLTSYELQKMNTDRLTRGIFSHLMKLKISNTRIKMIKTIQNSSLLWMTLKNCCLLRINYRSQDAFRKTYKKTGVLWTEEGSINIWKEMWVERKEREWNSWNERSPEWLIRKKEINLLGFVCVRVILERNLKLESETIISRVKPRLTNRIQWDVAYIVI